MSDRSTAEFVLDLGCVKDINMVELVNTHSGVHRDRGTKEFQVGVVTAEVSESQHVADN